MPNNAEPHEKAAFPDWAANPPGSIFLCWEDRWWEGAAALVTDEGFAWTLPEGLATGDVLITVLGSDPSLVVSVERVDAVTGYDVAVSKHVLALPVPWQSVVDGLPTRPERASERLDDGVQALATISQLSATGPDVTVPLTCQVDSPSALTVAAVLYFGPDLDCAACSERVHPADAIAHYEGARSAGTLQEALDETSMLCPPCHRLLHRPSIGELRRRLRPACPNCGLRDYVTPVVWGLPADPPDPGEDIVYGGCTPPAPAPQWHCRDCNVGVLVAVIGEPDVEYGGTEHLPIRYRDREVHSLGDLARVLRVRPTVSDIEDALFDRFEHDIRLRHVDDRGFELLFDNISGDIDYPFTVADFYRRIEDDIAMQAELRADEDDEVSDEDRQRLAALSQDMQDIAEQLDREDFR